MIKQIQSSQFFQIGWLRFVFSISTIFFIIALALLIVYASVRKQKLLPSGAIAYKPLNPAILYASVISSLCALFGYVTCVIQYIRIFRFSLTPMFYLLTASSVSSIVVLSVTMYYLLRPSACDSGFILDTTLNQCVPDCPIGTKLDYTTQTCIPGCVSKDDCIGGTECVSGQCCKYVTDINCGDACCDPSNCQDGQVCCPKDKYCDDGVCCGEIGGCINGHCRVYCPDADHTCELGQACFSFDASTTHYPGAYEKDGKAYLCSTISDNCQPDANPQFFPHSLGTTSSFYPAAGLPTGQPGQDVINDALNYSGSPTEAAQIIDELLGNDPNLGHLGAYCGTSLATPIRIVSQKHTGTKCTPQSCLDYVYPNITTNVSAVTDDSGQLFCNMIIDNDYAPSVSGYQKDQKGASEYTATYYDNGKPMSTTYPMKGSDPLKATDSSYYTFQKDCSVFKGKCPNYDDSTVTCETADNIGWFNRVQSGAHFCTVPINASGDDYQNTTKCTTVSKGDEYNAKGYISCNNDADKCPTSSDQLHLNPDIAKDSDVQEYGTIGVCWVGGNTRHPPCYNVGSIQGPDYFKKDVFYPGNAARRPCQIGGLVPILRISPGWHATKDTDVWSAYLDAFCCDPEALQTNLSEYGLSLDNIAGSPYGDGDTPTDTINTVMKLSCGPPASGSDGEHGPLLGVVLGKKTGESCITGHYDPTHGKYPGRDNCLPGFIQTVKDINSQNINYITS